LLHTREDNKKVNNRKKEDTFVSCRERKDSVLIRRSEKNEKQESKENKRNESTKHVKKKDG
jgi:hypothetical protein